MQSTHHADHPHAWNFVRCSFFFCTLAEVTLLVDEGSKRAPMSHLYQQQLALLLTSHIIPAVLGSDRRVICIQMLLWSLILQGNCAVSSVVTYIGLYKDTWYAAKLITLQSLKQKPEHLNLKRQKFYKYRTLSSVELAWNLKKCPGLEKDNTVCLWAVLSMRIILRLDGWGS